MKHLKSLAAPWPTLFALLLSVIVWQSAAQAANSMENQVTNKSSCWGLSDRCDGFDKTLPARPKANFNYAEVLKSWAPGRPITPGTVQAMLGATAQPLGDSAYNAVVTQKDNPDTVYPVYTPNQTLKAAMWDVVVADYLQQAVALWDQSLSTIDLKDAYSKAKSIQKKFREIQVKGGGPDIAGSRNPLLGAIIGYGGTTYGDVFRSEGALEGKLEGLLIESHKTITAAMHVPENLHWTSVAGVSDLANAVATVLQKSTDQQTHDLGFLMANLTTATVGALSGGATLLVAPAQIAAGMFDEILLRLDNRALEGHFMARYYLATHSSRDSNLVEEFSTTADNPNEAVIDLYKFQVAYSMDDRIKGPLATRILDYVSGNALNYYGPRTVCPTANSSNCLKRDDLKSAYLLADFLATVRLLGIDNIKAALAGYALADYATKQSFTLDVTPNTPGAVFQVSVPQAKRTGASGSDWNWSEAPYLGRLQSFKGDYPSLQGTLDFVQDSYKPSNGDSGTLSVWIDYLHGDGLSRLGLAKLTYVSNAPSTNRAPVLKNKGLYFPSGWSSALIRPSFTDDGDRAKASISVQQPPTCGTLKKGLLHVIYKPNAGSNCPTDSFTWIVIDERGRSSNVGSVLIKRQASANRAAPAAANSVTSTPELDDPISINVEQGKSVTFSLQATDAQQDPDLLVYTTSVPVNGVLKPTGIYPDEFTYTHNGANTNEEALTYTVSNGTLSASANLTITVMPPQDHLPYANGQIVSVSPGKSVTVKLDGGDEDVADQPNLVYSILTPPANGSATLNGSTLTYTPTTPGALADTLQWQVRDTVKDVAASAGLGITVLNRQPVIAGIDNVAATSGVPVSVNLSATDPDGGTLTWTLASGSPGQIDGTVWSNTFTQAGVYPVRVIASNPNILPENSPSRVFTIIVDGACTFTDVPRTYAYYTTVCAAAGKQWVVGYTIGGQLVFKPEQGITRGEFAKLAFKFLEEDRGLTLTTGSTPSYPDVPATHGLFSFIQTLTDIGLLHGYADHTFKPDNAMSRAEMALLVNRMGGWGHSGVDTVFKDVPLTPPTGVSEADWLEIYFAIGQLANRGIVSHTNACVSDASAVCFRPNDSLSRVEALLVLERLPAAIATQLLEGSSGSGTWSDAKTGLTWMRCALGQTWENGTCTGDATTYTWEQAKALTLIYAGQSDWRLPKIRELKSIVDYSRSYPAIDGIVYPATPSKWFWSGSQLPWVVHFGFGTHYAVASSESSHVRLVRNGEPSALLNDARPTSDYVDQGDGTVTHSPTGLMWMRCAHGQSWNGSTCTGTADMFSWDQAKALSQTYAGHSDWRLPGIMELTSLPDYTKTQGQPAVNESVFPLSPAGVHWSASSTPSPFLGNHWMVNGNSGGSGVTSVNLPGYARLVRTGQPSGTLFLMIGKSGTGVGTVGSTPSGINCGSSCSANFASGVAVTLTATPTTGSTFTGWGGACSGTSPFCTLTMDAAKSVTASFSSGLAPQTIAFDPGPTAVALGFSFNVSAPASSGLPVTFSSLTPDLCTVSGSTVTGVSAGICTLAANQAGNSTYAAAPQATLSFIIAASIVPPGPPTITSIKAGSGSATIDFSAPSDTGGSPISSYTASCAATGQTTRTANGTASPLTVRNLTGGVLYQCSLTATNGAGFSSTASAAMPVTATAKKSSMTPILMLLLD